MDSATTTPASTPASTPARITVFLADDNVIVREGVKALLGLESDIEVVGTAADYDELVAGADRAEAQVLVTDIRKPDLGLEQAIKACEQQTPKTWGCG